MNRKIAALFSASIAVAVLGYMGQVVHAGERGSQLATESPIAIHKFGLSDLAGLVEQPAHPENHQQPEPTKKAGVTQDHPVQSDSPDQPIQNAQPIQRHQPVQQNQSVHHNKLVQENQPIQHSQTVQHSQPVQHNKPTQYHNEQIVLHRVSKEEPEQQFINPEKHHKHKHHKKHKKHKQGKNNNLKGKQQKKKQNNNHNKTNKPNVNKKEKNKPKQKVNISLEIIDENELEKTQKSILDYLIIYVEKPVQQIVNQLQYRIQGLNGDQQEAE